MNITPTSTMNNPTAAPRKTRSDAILKNLPTDRQEGIVEHARTRSLAETAEWLAGTGIQVSHQTVSEFLHWHVLRQQVSHAEGSVEILRESYQNHSRLTPEEVDRLGQRFFTGLAIDKSDSEAWQRTQNVRLKQQALQLETRRLDLLEKKAAQTGDLDSGDLTPEVQRARLREILQ